MNYRGSLYVVLLYLMFATSTVASVSWQNNDNNVDGTDRRYEWKYVKDKDRGKERILNEKGTVYTKPQTSKNGEDILKLSWGNEDNNVDNINGKYEWKYVKDKAKRRLFHGKSKVYTKPQNRKNVLKLSWANEESNVDKINGKYEWKYVKNERRIHRGKSKVHLEPQTPRSEIGKDSLSKLSWANENNNFDDINGKYEWKYVKDKAKKRIPAGKSEVYSKPRSSQNHKDMLKLSWANEDNKVDNINGKYEWKYVEDKGHRHEKYRFWTPRTFKFGKGNKNHLEASSSSRRQEQRSKNRRNFGSDIKTRGKRSLCCQETDNECTPECSEPCPCTTPAPTPRIHFIQVPGTPPGQGLSGGYNPALQSGGLATPAFIPQQPQPIGLHPGLPSEQLGSNNFPSNNLGLHPGLPSKPAYVIPTQAPENYLLPIPPNPLGQFFSNPNLNPNANPNLNPPNPNLNQYSPNVVPYNPNPNTFTPNLNQGYIQANNLAARNQFANPGLYGSNLNPYGINPTLSNLNSNPGFQPNNRIPYSRTNGNTNPNIYGNVNSIPNTQHTNGLPSQVQANPDQGNFGGSNNQGSPINHQTSSNQAAQSGPQGNANSQILNHQGFTGSQINNQGPTGSTNLGTGNQGSTQTASNQQSITGQNGQPSSNQGAINAPASLNKPNPKTPTMSYPAPGIPSNSASANPQPNTSPFRPDNQGNANPPSSTNLGAPGSSPNNQAANNSPLRPGNSDNASPPVPTDTDGPDAPPLDQPASNSGTNPPGSPNPPDSSSGTQSSSEAGPPVAPEESKPPPSHPPTIPPTASLNSIQDNALSESGKPRITEKQENLRFSNARRLEKPGPDDQAVPLTKLMKKLLNKLSKRKALSGEIGKSDLIAKMASSKNRKVLPLRKVKKKLVRQHPKVSKHEKRKKKLSIQKFEVERRKNLAQLKERKKTPWKKVWKKLEIAS